MAEQARAEWSESMSALALDCADSGAADTRKRIAKMWRLIDLAPQPVLLKGITPVSASRMQALLAAEAFESAAVELLGGPAHYSTSLAEYGHLALITLPGDDEEARCVAETFALALVGALASALARRSQQPLVRLVGRSAYR